MAFPNVSDHEARIAALEAKVATLQGQSSTSNSGLAALIAKLKKWFPFFN